MIVGRASRRFAAKRLRTLGKVDLRADRDRKHHPGGVLVGMRQRQKTQEHLVAETENFEQAIGAAAVGDDVAVGGDHPLGDAPGARGEDQAGDVVRRHLGDALRYVVGRLVAPRQHFLPRHDVDRACLARGGLDRDHRAHGVDLVRRRQHPRGQSGLRDDHRTSCRCSRRCADDLRPCSSHRLEP